MEILCNMASSMAPNNFVTMSGGNESRMADCSYSFITVAQIENVANHSISLEVGENILRESVSTNKANHVFHE